MDCDTPRLLKHTIARSPLITQIYSKFKVNLSKSPSNYNSTSIDHENLLTSKKWNELLQNANSQSYDFDDDDFDMNELMEISENKDDISLKTEANASDNEIMSINLLIKDSSISINDFSNNYNLPYTVRSSCHLKAINGDQDDDTLLICLKSGFLLLIKFFLIENHLKPMVIQDINLQSSTSGQTSVFRQKLGTLGKNIYSQRHNGHGVIALTSQCSNIKFSLCNGATNKISNSINFFVDGTILMSCFIDVPKSKHLMFVTLLITTQRKLQFRLFEKWEDETLDQISQYTPILLPSDFKIPHFICSVNSMLVLIYDNSIQLMGLSFLINYDLNDCMTIPFASNTESITNFHILTDNLVADAESSEILISTSTGNIYSVIIKSMKDDIDFKLLFRANSSSITSFVMYPFYDDDELRYKYICGSDSSPPEMLVLDSSFTKIETSKLSNWSPVIDVAVVQSNNKREPQEEELWLLSGKSKKTSLYHLHKGIEITTLVVDSLFKHAEQSFHIETNSAAFFCFNYFNSSSLYRYDGTTMVLMDEQLIDDLNISAARTLSFAKIKHNDQELAVHTTSSSLTIFDPVAQTITLSLRFEVSKILLCDVIDNLIVLIHFNSHDGHICELFEVDTQDDHDEISISQLSGFALQNTQQPSMLKCFKKDQEAYFAIGYFNNDISFHSVSSAETEDSCFSGMISLGDWSDSFAIPYDFAFANDESAFLITSRNGYYAIVNTVKSEPKFVNISDNSVKIVAKDPGEYFLVSRSLFRLQLKDSLFPTKCYSQSVGSASNNFNYNKVKDLVFLQKTREVVALGNSGLSISIIADNKEQIVIGRKIKLYQDCRRLYNAMTLKMFIVLKGSSYRLEDINIEDTMEFVDQATKKTLKIEYDRQPFLDENEIPMATAEWKFEYCNANMETKCHLQLLFSCYNIKENKTTVKVVEAQKTGEGSVILRKLFQWYCTHSPPQTTAEGDEKQKNFEYDNKVNLIKQFSNTMIVYGYGHELYFIKYLPDQRAFDKPTLISSFNSNINCLSVEGSRVAVSTSKEVFVLYDYDVTSQTFVSHIPGRRLYDMSSHMLSGDILVAAEKYSNALNVIPLREGGGPGTIFRTDSVLKIVPCRFSSRISRQQDYGNKFIACAVNGDISLYSLLSTEQYTKLEKFMKQKKHAKLFDLNYANEWFINNDKKTTVIEADRLDPLAVANDGVYHEEIDMMLNELMI